MKALTLYIDKWYIIGAVCTDGVPRLIKPKTGEECFWLYFYEDVNNDEIVYGKDNKSHYHNNENHYYGDVFSLLTDGTTSFIRYDHKEDIAKIFKASGIIDELKDSIGTVEGKIETYISFSKDISDAARLVFKQDVLLPENFEIKESVARIGHLALEHAFRHNHYSSDGYYLLLNACNENLIYSLYERKDNLLLRKAEASLNGMGTDLRGRAIIEKVVKSINQSTHFLKTEKEFEYEYLRLAQDVDKWILRLENAKPGRPVTIPNVSFSRIGNTYQATILKKDIDARTSVIVGDIIREIVTFVRNSGVTNDSIQGVLFLGNTFTNSQFLSAIKEQYTLANNKYVHYKTSDLPYIVAVYTVMDCNQFAVATEISERQGEAELEMQRLAREEKERQEKAEAIRKQKDEESRAAREADLRYEEAMRNVYDYEKKREYAQMEEWATIALTHHPNDSEAEKKKADAIRLLSEQRVREDQYKAIISRAEQSFKERQWQEALSQSDAALNLKPDSAEAKRIYNESKKHIENAKKVDKCINRADLFLAQKSYDEALKELAKVLNLDPDNAEAALRIEEIEGIRKEHARKVSTLVDNYKDFKAKENFDAAISICEKLAEIDTNNKSKWSAEIERLKAEKNKVAEIKKRLEELKKKADDADFTDDWPSFIHYAEEILSIKPNQQLSLRVEKAKKKIKEKEHENEYQKQINIVNTLIANSENDEAGDILNRLQKQFPGHLSEIKALRQKTFVFSESHSDTRKSPKVGFKTENDSNSKTNTDDFFGTDVTQKKQTSRPTKPASPTRKTVSQPKKKSPNKTGDDFFDMDTSPNKIKG